MINTYIDDRLKERDKLILDYKEKKNNLELWLNSLPNELDLRKCYRIGREAIDYINDKNYKWSWYDAFIIDKSFFSRKYYVELKWACSWHVGNIVNKAGSKYYNNVNKLECMRIKSIKKACEELDSLKRIIEQDINNRI